MCRPAGHTTRQPAMVGTVEQDGQCIGAAALFHGLRPPLRHQGGRCGLVALGFDTQPGTPTRSSSPSCWRTLRRTSWPVRSASRRASSRSPALPLLRLSPAMRHPRSASATPRQSPRHRAGCKRRFQRTGRPARRRTRQPHQCPRPGGRDAQRTGQGCVKAYPVAIPGPCQHRVAVVLACAGRWRRHL